MPEVAQAGQNTGTVPPGQGTKSIEQLMAENDALLKEKTSLQGSVQGLSRKNQEQEDRLKAYEANGGSAGAGDTGDGQLWISREAATKLADDRIKAWETQKRQEADESQKAFSAFEGEIGRASCRERG